MSLPARVTTLVIAFVAVVALGVFVAMHFIAGKPPVENYTPYASGGQVNVVMQTAPETTSGSDPDWVTYYVQDPKTKQWVHTTYFSVPADTKVNVTIEGYDGCTPLRNPVWGQVTGTIGDVEHVQYVNGKSVTPVQSFSQFNSWADCSVQHTFAIPSLGINVPVASPTTENENNNLCGTAPCTSGPHSIVTFSFMTPKTGGTYRWQCFVPCGGGYVDGNGGPMATPGYMMGQMEVQA